MEWITSTRLLEELQSSNDGDAWRNFCTSFLPMLSSFAKSLGLPASYAEDAAQETMAVFVKTFRAGNYEREQGRLHNWLFGIARNVMRDLKKRLPREIFITNSGTGTSFWDAIEDEDIVKHTWNTEWRRMALMSCIEQARREFDAQVFEAFELYALMEKPADEVAKQLNMSRNAVYIAKSRVLSKMRELESEFE